MRWPGRHRGLRRDGPAPAQGGCGQGGEQVVADNAAEVRALEVAGGQDERLAVGDPRQGGEMAVAVSKRRLGRERCALPLVPVEVGEVGSAIVTLRAEARARHGWIMDTYLLRR